MGSPDAKYNDYDWDELPADIKAAYITLGWTEAIWDADGEPDSEDLDWDELSPEQQAAAKKLGYNKGKTDSI